MGALRAIRLVVKAVGLLEIGLGVALLASIVIAICYQVASRFLFGSPLPWAEEFATYCFIWLTFLGAGLAMKLDRHIRIAALDLVLPPRGRVILHAAALVVVVAIFLLIATQTLPVLPIEMRTTSVSLPIDIPRGLLFSGPLLFGCASIVASAVYAIFADIATLSGDQQPPLFDIRSEDFVETRS
jgi:TRAP-type C4-dicarboxylate transport system permease small subunit